MTKFSKIVTASIAALALAGAITATPASAGSYYYRRSGPDAGAVAGAAIAGMAVGAMMATSHPRYGYYGGPYSYSYGYAPHHYGYYGYGY